MDLFSRRILFLFEGIREEKLDNMLLFDMNEFNDAGKNWLRGVARGLMVFDDDLGGFDKESYVDTMGFLSLIAFPEEIDTDEDKKLIESILNEENVIDLAISYLSFLNYEITNKLSQMPETVKNVPKPKRNDLCSCGSGKKYKKCCGNHI